MKAAVLMNGYKEKNQSFLTDFLELMTGFEPVTSSLPRMRSTY